MEKHLILIRGLPGSGKSTFAKLLKGVHLETDQYFVDTEGNYNFDHTQLKDAHGWCKHSVKCYMELGEKRIIVSNTFTQTWEIEPYFELAGKHGYTVHTLVKENRHCGESIHNIPEETLHKMAQRFNVKII